MSSSSSRVSVFFLLFSAIVLTSSTVEALTTWQPFKRGGKVIDYTPYFSEERGGFSGRQTAPIAAVECNRKYCDNKRLVTVREGAIQPVQNSGYWTHWFSDGSPNHAYCPSDMVVNEIQCRGKYCDDLRLQCGRLISGYRVISTDVKTVPWFSEETGRRFCPDGYYLWGMACSRSYCDNILLKCVRIDYQVTTSPWKLLVREGNRLTYSRYFSEEGQGYSGRMLGPITGLRCSGKYCDSKQLVAVQRGTYVVEHTGYWTNWFSEEYPGSARCPHDMVVNEIQCRSKYCDNMRLQCGRVRTGYRIRTTNSKSVGFFSEEQGLRYCPNGYYVSGVSCRGKYCDQLLLTCVIIEYAQ